MARAIVFVVVGLVLAATAPGAGAGLRLSLSHELVDGRDGITTLGGVTSVAVAPDGAFVYALATGDTAVTVLSRDVVTGALGFVEAEQPVGSEGLLIQPRLMAIDPLGVFAYVFGKTTAVVLFRNWVTGHLSFQMPVAAAPNDAGGIAFGPFGTHVYVTDVAEDRVAVYAQNAVTGALTLVQLVEHGAGGALLDGASAVAVSPDGAHVYVTSEGDDAVVVFSRDPGTGQLSLLEQHVDGVAGVHGLGRPTTIAVSPDGAHLYAGGRSQQGLVVFARDGLTGALTYVDGEQFAHRIARLAMGADGTRMVAQSTSGDPDRVLLLERDLGTGLVAVVSAETFAENRGIAIGPDGVSAYAGSPDRLGAFRIIDGTCGAPAVGCGQPTRPLASALTVRDTPDDKDQLQWKWTKGSALAIADFGSPQALPVDVRVCLYDANGALLVDAVVPALASCRGKSCWKQSSNGTTLRYRDSHATPEGVRSFGAKAGSEGFSSLKVKLKSGTFAAPPPPLTTPVTLQVRSGTGACWEAVYGTPQLNVPGSFKAKSD